MTTEKKHALLSPSSAEKWLSCPGSLVMEKGLPNQRSTYSDFGTCAHELAALTLLDPSRQTFTFLDQESKDVPGLFFVEEMCTYVQTYVDFVLQYAEGHKLFVEQKLSLTNITGEENADGTSDAVIVADDEIIIIDLKYGMGVEVSAEENKQLMLYALSAVEEYSYITDFKRVRLVIHQPRINAISEWDMPIEDLMAYKKTVKEVATKVLEYYNAYEKDSSELDQYLVAGEDQCRWCKAKSFCPKLRGFVEEAVGVNFEDVTKEVVTVVKDNTNELIGTLLPKLGLIEDWIKAVKDKAESELHLGNAIPGYKLVEGRKGHRKWTSKDEAEALMKSMRLKQEEMYSFEVISPTQAEKLLADNNPRKWGRLEVIITQSKGSPTVVPEKDKRPAIAMKSVEFAAVENVDDLC